MSPDADNALDTKSDKESGAAEEHCEDEKLDQHGNASSSCASISRIVKAFMFSSGGIAPCPGPLKGGRVSLWPPSSRPVRSGVVSVEFQGSMPFGCSTPATHSVDGFDIELLKEVRSLRLEGLSLSMVWLLTL